MIGGLPFFKTSILADLVYSGILFGVYFLAQQVAVKNKEAVAA